MNIKKINISRFNPVIQTGRVPRIWLGFSILVSLIYLSWWLNFSHVNNIVLYSLLLFGEIYHVGMAILFWITIWPHKRKRIKKKKDYYPSVDVFITVAGEPVEVVEQTALAAKKISYPNHNVYILNDGFVAKKENWRDIEVLAERIGVNCITRTTPGGAKAGNINHALAITNGEIVVIFDADMVASPQFLNKTIPYFVDKRVGFVQTPQYYKNYDENNITQASWQQQEFFFGPIMVGKNSYNSAFVCGTNVAIRRVALIEAGGMFEKNIAEDFLTSLFIHQNGWKSHYVPDVLASGLAPSDLLSYFKQQHRWSRGSLEVLFNFNPLFSRHLSFAQKIQYLSSALFYFNGLVVLIDITMPLIFLFTGLSPVSATTTSFAFYFIPFLFFGLYTLNKVSEGNLSFKAVSFTQSSFTLQLLALKAVLLREKTSFSVTPKKAQSGNFLFLAYPHILYIILTAVGMGVAIIRDGINASLAANFSWAVFNIFMFIPFITASMNWNKASDPNLSPAKTS